MGIFSEGLGFIGDMIGLDQQEDQHDASVRMANQNIALQKEFAQHGITWRTEDARRAGLHPLFALQGGGAAFAPNPIIMPEESPGIGRAARAAGQTIDEWRGNQAALDAAAAATEKDRAIADYYRSEAARARQARVATKPVVSGLSDAAVQINPISPPQHVDWVKLEADPVMAGRSTDQGITAGVNHPGMRQFELPGGFRMLMPATQGGGMPEEIDIGMWPFVLGANLKEYGARWIVDALNYATGATPAETRAQDRRIVEFLRRIFRGGANSMEGVSDGFSSP